MLQSMEYPLDTTQEEIFWSSGSIVHGKFNILFRVPRRESFTEIVDRIWVILNVLYCISTDLHQYLLRCNVIRWNKLVRNVDEAD